MLRGADDEWCAPEEAADLGMALDARHAVEDEDDDEVGKFFLILGFDKFEPSLACIIAHTSSSSKSWAAIPPPPCKSAIVTYFQTAQNEINLMLN